MWQKLWILVDAKWCDRSPDYGRGQQREKVKWYPHTEWQYITSWKQNFVTKCWWDVTKTFQDVTQYLQINLESGSCEIAPPFPWVTTPDYSMQLQKSSQFNSFFNNNQWKKWFRANCYTFPNISIELSNCGPGSMLTTQSVSKTQSISRKGRDFWNRARRAHFYNWQDQSWFRECGTKSRLNL